MLNKKQPVKGAVVARENILTINVDEPIPAFVARTEQLAQWGDRREKRKRNRTLILSGSEMADPELLQALRNTKIAGIALFNVSDADVSLDRLIDAADQQAFFVMSTA